MTIQARISGVLLGAVIAAALGVAGCLLWLEGLELERQMLEKPQLILSSVPNVAKEALLFGDPMILTSHLVFLQNTHPEIAALRLRSGERWVEVRRPQARPTEGGPVVVLSHTARVHDAAHRLREATVEMTFSRTRLESARRTLFRDSARSAGLVVALAALLGLPLSLWAGRLLTGPIGILGRGMQRIADGEKHLPLPAGGRDEMGGLIVKFNAMAEKLKEMDRMKKDFVSSVTHELKTPLGAIESFVRLLAANTSLDAAGRSQLRQIEASLQRLTSFVTQLLQAAKIERGTFDLAPKPTDIAALIRDTAIFFEPRARECGIRLSVELAPGELSAHADAERLQQVLVNLVGNAFKFTPSGGQVTVYAKRRDAGGAPALELGVIDSGIGIGEADQARLFQPFEQIDNPLAKGGTGLGLYIARMIVELHGGSLAVESAPGAGSRFYFAIPVSMAAKVG